MYFVASGAENETKWNVLHVIAMWKIIDVAEKIYVSQIFRDITKWQLKDI